MAGTTWGSFGGALQGLTDFFVAKYASDGSTLWVRQSGAAGSINFGYAVAADPDGSVFLTSQTNGDYAVANPGGMDVTLAKYDPNGNFVWKKQFGTSQGDAGRGMVLDYVNHLYITGETSGDLDGNTNPAFGTADMFLTKYVK